MADEVEKVKRAAAATISKLTEEKARLEQQLRALQRAVSESQRVAAEASEQVDALRAELQAEKQVTATLEARNADKLAALDRAAKQEREKAAAAELAHHAAAAASAAAAAAQERRLQEEVQAVRGELATEKERVAELQRSVEHLTRAGEEAKELWARLKQALLAEEVRDAPVGTIKAMMKASAEPEAFAQQCAELDATAASDPAAFAELLARGCAAVVCVGMAVHRQNADVQKWGCAVLGRLAPFTSDDAGDALKQATAGAVEAVVAALRAHLFSVDVQEHGCAALTKLTFKSGENRTRAVAVGAVDVVAACMRVHGAASPIVQEQAWFLLGALGEHAKAGGEPGGAGAAGAAGAPPA